MIVRTTGSDGCSAWGNFAVAGSHYRRIRLNCCQNRRIFVTSTRRSTLPAALTLTPFAKFSLATARVRTSRDFSSNTRIELVDEELQEDGMVASTSLHAETAPIANFRRRLFTEESKMKSFYTCALLAIATITSIGHAGEPTCCADSICVPGTCCPKCGCHEGLLPVCHSYCDTKKVIKYKYCCTCEEMCIPGHAPCCETCNNQDGGCAVTCGSDDGKCDCTYRNVKKLVKIPYLAYEPVRKCNVEWTCPKCGCACCNSLSNVEVSEAANVATQIAPSPIERVSLTSTRFSVPNALTHEEATATAEVRPVYFDAPVKSTFSSAKFAFPVR